VAASQQIIKRQIRSTLSGGVGSTSQNLRAQDSGKSRQAENRVSNVQSARTSKIFTETFTHRNNVEGASGSHEKQGAER